MTLRRMLVGRLAMRIRHVEYRLEGYGTFWYPIVMVGLRILFGAGAFLYSYQGCSGDFTTT